MGERKANLILFRMARRWEERHDKPLSKERLDEFRHGLLDKDHFGLEEEYDSAIMPPDSCAGFRPSGSAGADSRGTALREITARTVRPFSAPAAPPT